VREKNKQDRKKVIIVPYVTVFDKKPPQYVLPFGTRTKLIELGGGKKPIIHPNLDILPGDGVDIVHDLGVFPWPLETEAYEGIFAQYVLEHIPWRDVRKFISELYRITSKDGVVTVITANTVEQCKKVVEQGASDQTAELLFGSQEFPNHGGVHKNLQSPEFTKKLFLEAGFKSVNILPHPVSSTDLIVEAFKMKDDMFEREYFEDGTIGYREYRDFCTTYSVARHILKNIPESVIDVGCGRAYVVRVLENNGIKAIGMDISKHCWQTRATDSFILHDATITPWPIGPSTKTAALVNPWSVQFDTCFSNNFLEHIPEEKIDDVIREMARVSKRGFHAIHYLGHPYIENDKDNDVTHVSMHDKSWWENKFKTIVPDYPIIIEYPRTIEYENPYAQPPTSVAPGVALDKDGKIKYADDLNKLNIGSYKNMFYFGWINCDILDLKNFAEGQVYRFRQFDVKQGIPCQDNDVDIINHSHLLEHLDRIEGFQFLKECYRVLKPGGIIRISVPDGKKLIGDYVYGRIKDYRYINVGVEKAEDDAEALYELLMSNHKTIYDDVSLSGLLKKVGFKDITEETAFTSRSDVIRTQSINTFPMISLILEASK
jgi:predicted SAM-dependent methyltransferase